MDEPAIQKSSRTGWLLELKFLDPIKVESMDTQVRHYLLISKSRLQQNQKVVGKCYHVELPWLLWQLACPDDHSEEVYQENQWPATSKARNKYHL